MKTSTLYSLTALVLSSVKADFVLFNTVSSIPSGGDSCITCNPTYVYEINAAATSCVNCDQIGSGGCNSDCCRSMAGGNSVDQNSFYTISDFCCGNTINLYSAGDNLYNGYISGGDGSIIATCTQGASVPDSCPYYLGDASSGGGWYCSSNICSACDSSGNNCC